MEKLLIDQESSSKKFNLKNLEIYEKDGAWFILIGRPLGMKY